MFNLAAEPQGRKKAMMIALKNAAKVMGGNVIVVYQSSDLTTISASADKRGNVTTSQSTMDMVKLKGFILKDSGHLKPESHKK